MNGKGITRNVALLPSFAWRAQDGPGTCHGSVHSRGNSAIQLSSLMCTPCDLCVQLETKDVVETEDLQLELNNF